ncbi:hypothetical protein [Geomonas agri]|uniref:hypothetical protein n=1 Tax=Geomonas agri TaxID=2873702 RepID=UPI001CD56EB6|nr:hypothetical protein [Geomonas agri]
MKKIFYLEDELSVDTMIRLFGFISPEIVEELESIDRNSPNIGERIVDAFKSNPLIRVENTFVGAIKELGKNGCDYDLFIIDRNLSKTGYRYNYVGKLLAQQKMGKEGEKLFQPQREGDAIVNLLFARHLDFNGSVDDFVKSLIFLTANPDLGDGIHVPMILKGDKGKQCIVCKDEDCYDVIRHRMLHPALRQILLDNYETFGIVSRHFENPTLRVLREHLLLCYRYLQSSPEHIAGGLVQEPNPRLFIEKIVNKVAPHIKEKSEDRWKLIEDFLSPKLRNDEKHILPLMRYIHLYLNKKIHGEMPNYNLTTPIHGCLDVLKWFDNYAKRHLVSRHGSSFQ